MQPGVEIEDRELYEFLLKDCASLTQQIEELLKESVEPVRKSTKTQQALMADPGFEDKPESFDSAAGAKPEQAELNEDEAEEKKEDYTKKKEALLSQKKYLEDQFLDINIDIQKKAKQLTDFQETVKKTKMEIAGCDRQIKEKTEFIQFLEEQIRGLSARGVKK